MIVELTALSQSIKAFYELTKATVGFRESTKIAEALVEINAKLMETQAAALTAQDRQLSLTKQIGELEKEIMDLKNWEREAQRYELSEIASDVFAYKLKPGVQPPEPSHMLCQNCYLKCQKSILQLLKRSKHGKWYKCHNCNHVISTYEDPGVPPQGPQRTPWIDR